MFKSKHAGMLLCILLGAATLACGSIAPPASCGEGIGGTADEARFAEHFATMQLVNAATGQPGPEDPEGGAQFASGDELTVQAESLGEVEVRLCVQRRTGGGAIPFDQTQTAPEGSASLALGTFEPGGYVIRVIVDGTLVKNFPFVVK